MPGKESHKRRSCRVTWGGPLRKDRRISEHDGEENETACHKYRASQGKYFSELANQIANLKKNGSREMGIL